MSLESWGSLNLDDFYGEDRFVLWAALWGGLKSQTCLGVVYLRVLEAIERVELDRLAKYGVCDIYIYIYLYIYVL